jgi:hypothetical protein
MILKIVNFMVYMLQQKMLCYAIFPKPTRYATVFEKDRLNVFIPNHDLN